MPESASTPLPMRWAALATLTAGLGGCYIVPIDHRTGQPLGGWQPPPPPAAAVVIHQAPPGPTVMQARLYPVNEQASQGGLLVAQIVDHQGGRGSISLNYRGQTLQGEATRVEAGYAGFGRVHDQVLGPARREYSGRRGVANAVGGGSSAQCEYVITTPTLGTGACLFTDGAKYQLHFGP